MTEQELIDIFTANGGPMFYSEFVDGLNDEQRRQLHRSFHALRHDGTIESGVPAVEKTGEYVFSDGTRSRARYRLAPDQRREEAA